MRRAPALQRVRPARALLSLPGLLALALVLSGAAAAALDSLQDRSEQRALVQVVSGAEVVGDLVVRRTVPLAALTGDEGLSAAQTASLQEDVQLLQVQHRVVGLVVRRADGSTLFADARLQEHHAAAQAPVGQTRRAAWVAEHVHPGEEPALAVHLPVLDREQVLGEIEVLVPQEALTAQVRAAGRALLAVTGALAVLLCAGLLGLRARLRRREHQARHDDLTGLLNRTALLEDADDVLPAPGAPRRAALLVLDLDGFKAVNDTLGHAAGDALLVQVAASLRAAVRPRDVVARLGGDEFAVLLPDVGPGEPDRTAAAVLAALRSASYEVRGVAVAVDASIGAALAPDHGTTVPELLQRADVAMYQAKRAHAGAATYDPATDTSDAGALPLLAELRLALEREELLLHYQPQLAVGTGAVVGVEALVRWQHPERGLVPPGDFVPLAERTGLVHPLTAQVLRTAVRQAAAWRAAGAPLRVSVNLSPRSLLEGDLPALVAAVLHEHDLPAPLLELEVTETAVTSDPVRAARVLGHLDALGVAVALDDFGAGATSLAHLRTMPVRTLKLDRSLVAHLLERPQDEAVTEAVIGLGHRLGLRVVAEGVETAPVDARLRLLGCDAVQGFLHARPLPAPALERWLAERRRAAQPSAGCSGVERSGGVAGVPWFSTTLTSTT